MLLVLLICAQVHLSSASSGAKLMLNSVLVIIVDDHLPGQLSFPQRFFTVKESQQCATVPVTRTYGSNGRVSVTFEVRSFELAMPTACAQRFKSYSRSRLYQLSACMYHALLGCCRRVTALRLLGRITPRRKAAWSLKTARPRRRSKFPSSPTVCTFRSQL